MSKIKDENYYQISGWMINRLQLKGAELQIFAIIYGFSQDGESMFRGSLSYLSDWVGASKPTIIRALKELVSKGYIIKETMEINGVTHNKYRAAVSQDADLTGSKDSLLGSKESLHNNNIDNNISHVSSKDDTFDKGCSTRSEIPVPSSGKLFSSEKQKTKKSSIQKTNNFISACQREAIKKEFPQEVLTELDKYFRMLAEMNCLLPAVSIAEQLAALKKVPADLQVLAIKTTIARGWKSLEYAAQSNLAFGSSNRGSFVDTSTPGTFRATPEEEKNGDWKNSIPNENIF